MAGKILFPPFADRISVFGIRPYAPPKPYTLNPSKSRKIFFGVETVSAEGAPSVVSPP